MKTLDIDIASLAAEDQRQASRGGDGLNAPALRMGLYRVSFDGAGPVRKLDSRKKYGMKVPSGVSIQVLPRESHF